MIELENWKFPFPALWFGEKKAKLFFGRCCKRSIAEWQWFLEFFNHRIFKIQYQNISFLLIDLSEHLHVKLQYLALFLLHTGATYIKTLGGHVLKWPKVWCNTLTIYLSFPTPFTPLLWQNCGRWNALLQENFLPSSSYQSVHFVRFRSFKRYLCLYIRI